jgi:hypothetical protein
LLVFLRGDKRKLAFKTIYNSVFTAY